ncbi:hypothetical protein NDU88_006205 [Pleurodeles waltl]|uniref:Uncharacterized protein n=1 Tax=Pleurodeles waltl TaxID=8319 RepID=A0AAV7TW64_PLEWA|nr:hypothetical protein NDU88_006205 [Pleurodeles waltl]
MIAAPLTLTPLVALLGYTEKIAPVHRRYLGFALLLAKRRVACCWGRGRAPKFKDWLSDLVYGRMQLKAYAELLPPTSRPRDIWAPLDTYLLGRLDPIDNGVSAGYPLEDAGRWEARDRGRGMTQLCGVPCTCGGAIGDVVGGEHPAGLLRDPAMGGLIDSG